MTEDLTEFDDIDPLELHLVQTAANGVDSPLLAKSVQQKGKNKLSKKMFKSGEDVLQWALTPFEEEVYKADQELADNPGTLTKEASRSAHMRRTVLKMSLAEAARARYPERFRTKFPNGVQIITNSRELPDDKSIQGWGWPRGSRAR